MAFEVDDELKAVAFLCLDRLIEGSLERMPVATAFFVSIDDLGERWMYLVTARHVIENAESDDIYARVNQRTQGFKEFKTHRDDWSLHATADVAATLLLSDSDSDMTLDAIPIPTAAFVGVDYRYRETSHPYDPGIAVAIGQEVYYVGLFTQHYGEERNLPIVRFGNISRMPQEIRLPRYQDNAESWFAMTAYLAESHSWAGHSGSPAFVVFPIHYEKKAMTDFGEMHMGDVYSQIPALIGLVSAHYDVPVKANVTGDVLGQITASQNSGIAVITPAHAIHELLTVGAMAEDRQVRTKTES